MSKNKKLQHKQLFNPAIGQWPDTSIWILFFFIEGHGMFCRFLQMHDTLQPTTGLKVWNTSPKIKYQQETLQLHFNSIVCTLPLPPFSARGEGGQPPTKFSKRGGLAEPQL